jgi:frataxin-like iron-binding protein CyaY
VNEVDRFESSTGNIITLRTNGTQWEVVNQSPDGEIVWTETSVSGSHLFTEDEARAEFERWRV